MERYTKKTWQGTQRNNSKSEENKEEGKEETEIQNPYIDELDKKKKKMRKVEVHTKNFDVEKPKDEDKTQNKSPDEGEDAEESKSSVLKPSPGLDKKMPNLPAQHFEIKKSVSSTSKALGD